MRIKKRMHKERIIAIAILIVFAAVVAYFFISSETLKPGEIPVYVTGELRMMYEWSRTTEGATLLEKLPCYCGCRYEGHKHARHCFWRDDGTFDKHGITCSVCFDIAKKAMQMNQAGKTVCEIRKDVDAFYAPNAHLGTETPMPEGCR